MNHGFYEESDLGIWAMFMLTSIVRLVFVKINIELVLQEQLTVIHIFKCHFCQVPINKIKK